MRSESARLSLSLSVKIVNHLHLIFIKKITMDQNEPNETQTDGVPSFEGRVELREMKKGTNFREGKRWGLHHIKMKLEAIDNYSQKIRELNAEVQEMMGILDIRNTGEQKKEDKIIATLQKVILEAKLYKGPECSISSDPNNPGKKKQIPIPIYLPSWNGTTGGTDLQSFAIAFSKEGEFRRMAFCEDVLARHKAKYKTSHTTGTLEELIFSFNSGDTQ